MNLSSSFYFGSKITSITKYSAQYKLISNRIFWSKLHALMNLQLEGSENETTQKPIFRESMKACISLQV